MNSGEDKKYRPGLRFLSGNEACAEAAIYAGCRFFAGYPITPSTEIAETLAERLPGLDGIFIQMEDEIASMAAVIGASLAGAKAMTATSGPGFSLKQENIGYACMAEVPCVIVDVMRGGPSTGSPTGPSQMDVMQAKWGTHGDHPVLAMAPNSVQETFTETVRAFNLSERLRTPVILLSDEIIAHMRERVILPEIGKIRIEHRRKPKGDPDDYKPYDAHGNTDIPAMAAFGDGYRFHVTGLSHDATGFPSNMGPEVAKVITRLKRKVLERTKEIHIWEEFMTDDYMDVLVVAYGSPSRSAKEAVRRARQLGIKAGLFRLITLWPFPDAKVVELADRSKAVLSPEMNLGQVALSIERCAGPHRATMRLNRVDGKLFRPSEILDGIIKLKNG